MNDRIKKIKLLALDVDGVLTDGKIIYDSVGPGVSKRLRFILTSFLLLFI